MERISGTRRPLVDQALAGAQDGVNKFYTTTRKFLRKPPYFVEKVFVNGQRLLATPDGADYTPSESGGPGTGYDTITLSWAPLARDVLLIDYFPSS